MDSLEERCDQFKDNDEQQMGCYCSIESERDQKHPQRILKLQYYEDQCNWNKLEFPLAIQQIGKFEKSNTGIVVNILLTA